MALLVMSAYAALVSAVPVTIGDDASSLAHGIEAPTCSNVFLQTVNHVEKASALTDSLRVNSVSCNEGTWPDKDHGLVCGECKVLVNRFNTFYKTCRGYCNTVGRQCAGAWEEKHDTCETQRDSTCDERIDSSDAICECGEELSESGTDACYGELAHVAVAEGNAVGSRVATGSAIECKRACSTTDGCESFSLCPQWSGCFMKDLRLTGDEATRVKGGCKTFYKKEGCSATTTTSTTPDVSEPESTTATTSTTHVSEPESTTTTATSTTPDVTEPEGTPCYGEMTSLAVDEGDAVGGQISTQSATTCKQVCSGSTECNSFTLCPKWNSCFMKSRRFSGGEATRNYGDCKTYYKTNGCTTTTTTPCVGSSCQAITVMSYNTEYKNYNARMAGYAAKIREIAPALVGLQECQNRDGLAELAGYVANKETGSQNYMLFDSSKVTFLDGGYMRIPRDNYATRFITWGRFRLGEVTIWFFNTHLPHNHNEASSQKTHAAIARMFLDKRKELGAENAPTIVVGDMNSHASNFNRVEGGGFESNLQANGFTWAYTARGNPGYGRIDHILYSTSHWTHNDCRDTGTGGSDHTSIACDLKLK